MRGERGGAIFIFHVLNAFEESARKNVAIHGDLRQRSTNKKDFFPFFLSHQGYEDE